MKLPPFLRACGISLAAFISVAASKLLQLALDANPLLYTDSGPILLNGWHANLPERSYLYGRFIRYCVAPLGSLQPLVVLQVLAGAAAALLLVSLLRRYAGVGAAAALAAALLLAWDPAQVVHERLVMTECAAGLVGALYLWISAKYIDGPRRLWLILAALLGVGLVCLRVVYIPLVWAAAALLPLVAHRRARGWRPLAWALLLSLGATSLGQFAYRAFTGAVFRREPAYHYRSGFFLAGNVAALLHPDDAASPSAAAIVRDQSRDGHPLADDSPEGRNIHLWSENGLVARLRRAIPDPITAERESRLLALHAIRRDPLGFLALGVRNLGWFATLLGPVYQESVSLEDGYNPKVQLSAIEWRFVGEHFPAPTPDTAFALTPSRVYHQYGAPWAWLAFLAPLLGFAAVWAGPAHARRTLLWLAIWSTMLLSATALFTPACLRYLHPLSFPAVAALAVLAARPFRHTPSA